MQLRLLLEPLCETDPRDPGPVSPGDLQGLSCSLSLVTGGISGPVQAGTAGERRIPILGNVGNACSPLLFAL